MGTHRQERGPAAVPGTGDGGGRPVGRKPHCGAVGEQPRDGRVDHEGETQVRIDCPQRIDLRLVLGMAIGGIPAVLLAAFVITSLPLTVLRWGVVVVVLYAAVNLLMTALKSRQAPVPAEQG